MKKLLFFAMMFFSIALTAQANSENCNCGDQVRITATPETGYHFVQWQDGNTENPRIVTVSADAHYTATFAPNIYKITFTDYQGNVIPGGGDYAYGTLIEFKGTTPTKPATAQYTYEFTGWNPTIVDRLVTKDESFAPVFKEIVNKYKIYFKNYDGTILQNTEFEYGATPAYAGSTPTKPATAQYTYTFKEWAPAIATVTGEATYTAKFDSVVNKYTVTFKNYNGTIVKEFTDVAYGTNPASLAVTTPTKPADVEYKYEFKGWTPEFVNVTGNATYTAEYTPIKQTYTVTFKDYDGSTLATVTVPYGETPAYPNANPVRPATAEFTYEFDAWTPVIVPVNEKAETQVYTATYKEIKNKYTVTVKVDDAEHGTVTGAGTYEYGETVTVIATPDGCYNFSKWSNGETSAEYTFTVTGNVDLTATFDIKKFTITVDSADNTMGTVTVEKL